MSSINNTLSSYLQSILNSSPITAQATAQSSGIGTSPAQPSDSGQLSPLARVLSTLQQLQQTDPAKYAQLTGEISQNLEGAAQTAQSQGNTSEANRLGALATDFSKASTTGQLPDFTNVAHGSGHSGHHHHGHHAHTSAGSTDTAASTTPVDQFLNTDVEDSGSQNVPTATSIILDTLAKAEVATS